jgi:hypothetical protein
MTFLALHATTTKHTQIGLPAQTPKYSSSYYEHIRRQFLGRASVVMSEIPPIGSLTCLILNDLLEPCQVVSKLCPKFGMVCRSAVQVTEQLR